MDTDKCYGDFQNDDDMEISNCTTKVLRSPKKDETKESTPSLLSPALSQFVPTTPLRTFF